MANVRPDIMEMVERMPAFPRSVQRVLELTNDLNSDPRDLVAVIEHDPVLVLKILKLVNSPYFGISQKITSVNHAIVTLGFNTVKNLALSTAAIGALPHKSAAGMDMDAFFLHSLATATIARLFAKKMQIPAKEAFDYFLSGLLHDFGKIVFAHFMPDEFHKALRMTIEEGIALCEAENEIFDTNHTRVGSLLGERWHLPINILESLAKHHDPAPPRLLCTKAVVAANEIGKVLKIGVGGNNLVGKLPDTITDLFGGDVNGIVAALGDINAEMEKVKVFISL